MSNDVFDQKEAAFRVWLMVVGACWIFMARVMSVERRDWTNRTQEKRWVAFLCDTKQTQCTLYNCVPCLTFPLCALEPFFSDSFVSSHIFGNYLTRLRYSGYLPIMATEVSGCWSR